MDPFTQRMLEKAEERSRALGVSNASASKFPLRNDDGSANTEALSGSCEKAMAISSQQKTRKQQLPIASGRENINKLQVIEKHNKETDSSQTPQKVLRQFSAVDKENMDLGIEISILTDKNVEVQVQVEEENDVATDKENETKGIKNSQQFDRPIVKIRDTSRNQLQRLGALYSNKADLSSPIHRTEGQFHAEEIESNQEIHRRMPKQRLGKLAALANTINQWEDDTSHRILEVSSKTENQSDSQKPVDNKAKPCDSNLSQDVKRVSSKSNDQIRREHATDNKAKSSESNLSKETRLENKSKTNKEEIKQLKWDPKVLNSLEAQGFQRRESSTVKVSYEFAEKNNGTEPILNTEKEKREKVEKPVIGKLNTPKLTPASSNSATESKTNQMDKNKPIIKTGLVSGRAAMFETQANSKQHSQHQKLEKDPTELSLKERMKLFEKNKGEALVPKAAFGMAPPLNKITHDSNTRREDKAKATSESSRSNTTNAYNPTATTPIVRAVMESKVRDKVNALINAACENHIKEDIKRQREEDLQLLANRYNKQKGIFADQKKETVLQSQVPPPPPPPPTQASVSTAYISSKRRSRDSLEDDNKRPRKITQQRLYPTLSDFESNDSCKSESDNCCTPATVSAMSSNDEIITATQPLNANCNQHNFNLELDEDNEDSYMESEEEGSSVDDYNSNFIQQKNDKPRVSKGKESTHVHDSVNTSNNSSDLSMGVDDYLDEALEENVHDGDDDCSQDDSNASCLSRDSDGTTASKSFSFHKANAYSGCKPIVEEPLEIRSRTFTRKSNIKPAMSPSNAMPPVKSEISVNKEDENVVTLVHTVSFYRKQQSSNSANSTPIRKIYREEQIMRSEMDNQDTPKVSNSSVRFQSNSEYTDDEDTQSDNEESDINLVHNKIKKLLDEVCKQQQVIAQTSQALNLCAATVEFSGSTESVEGERHLLVATNRRQACLDEVQRLRVEKSLRPIGAPRERGRLTVKEITIPLRSDYIRKLSTDAITGHHLVCLLKYNEHVLATKTVPTLPGLHAVKFPDILQLHNVYADFKITLEIYGMTAQREVLPHEVKYHINLNKKSGIKTPKKKGSDNRLIMPPVQSPAGPHVVRTPALVQYGFAIFSLREIQRTTWSLTQVLGVSPLEGIVHMKINCELSVTVEYKGFLTMFEDISGFGAWHRRWCHLNGTVLNYWKYPDDEKKKAPMGTIDLYTCTSQKITIAPRDICARLNTMLLECERPFKETDQESLIVVPNGRTTTIRHLLSADTKEEREEWCAYFNKSLTLLRAWGPPQ